MKGLDGGKREECETSREDSEVHSIDCGGGLKVIVAIERIDSDLIY